MFLTLAKFYEKMLDVNVHISFNKNHISSSVSIDCGLFTSVVEMVIYTKEQSFKMRLLVTGISALHGILSSCQTLKLQAFVFTRFVYWLEVLIS